MQVKKRPISVTVIALFIIITNGIGFVAAFAEYLKAKQDLFGAFRSSVPFLWSILTCVIMVISGIAMFKGYNWGRWLYLCFAAFLYVVNILVSEFKFHLPSLLIGGGLYIVILLLLIRPTASAFFRREGRDGSNESDDL